MGAIQTLATILGLSTVSGVNLYLTVFLVGVGQRLGWIHGLPSDLATLGHPLVIGVSGFLLLLEFVADKVPFITPFWDGIHTFIRPVGGALLALGAAAELHPVLKVVAVLAGGTIALGTHGSKMGVRLLAHTSPEPIGHSIMSFAEDVGVVALLALIYRHPAIALPVLGTILLATTFLMPLLFRALALVLHGFMDALQSLIGQGRRDQIPPWVELKALELSQEGASEALPCYVRRVRGAPRFKVAYLVQVEGRWQLIYRRWYRTRSLELADAPARCFPGFLWDTVVFVRDRRPAVLLVSRVWRHALAIPIVPGA